MVLLGGMLLAIYLKAQVLSANPSSTAYRMSLELFFILVAGSLMAALCAILLRRVNKVQVSKRIRFIALLLSLWLTSLAIYGFLPTLPVVQIIIYDVAVLCLGVITILWTPYIYKYGRHITIFYALGQLWNTKPLILMWIRYNISSRYSQTYLGIMWIIFIPLSTTLIIAFVFSQIMRPYDINDVPYISFFLAAVTFWNVFSQGVLNGSTSLVNSMGLITQVYFPREILIIIKVGETFVDLIFLFISMMVINLILGVFPNQNYIYLPIVIGIQYLLTLGICLLLSYLTVIARDVPNLISVLLQLAFYGTPILYPANVIPERFHLLLFINPIAPLIDAYRSIIVFNQPPDPVHLYGSTVTAFVITYVGYKFFKSQEKGIADFL